MDSINQITKQRIQKRHNLSIVAESQSKISMNEDIVHKENSFTSVVGDVHSCFSCYQIISNPICARCYLKHLNLWLGENIKNNELKRKIINQISSRVKNETLSEVDCIICGNESVCLCTYCFFFIAERVLEKFDISKSLRSRFGETFNYQIYHLKYF